MTDEAVWPDPGDWVVRLNDKLKVLDLEYYGFNLIRRMEVDPDETGNEDVVEGDPQANATLVTTAALAAVLQALREIPTFRGNVGLQSLSDLTNAMLDLDRGLRPALLQPRPGQTGVGDSAARRNLKAHVVLCVELLELAGYSNSAARQAIARVFADAGYTGRKGGRLSAKSIFDWGNDLAVQGADREGRRVIDRAMADWRIRRIWPPTAADVLTFASERAADPALRTAI